MNGTQTTKREDDQNHGDSPPDEGTAAQTPPAGSATETLDERRERRLEERLLEADRVAGGCSRHRAIRQDARVSVTLRGHGGRVSCEVDTTADGLTVHLRLDLRSLA